MNDAERSGVAFDLPLGSHSAGMPVQNDQRAVDQGRRMINFVRSGPRSVPELFCVDQSVVPTGL
jgi:hypothetical protein